MNVLTITSNDLGISWGPAIHFLELWNEISRLNEYDFHVEGVAPSWTGSPLIQKNLFPLQIIKVPNIKLFRQIFYDFFVAMKVFSSRNSIDIVYVRLSHWHLFVILALIFLRKKYVLELNGLAAEDSKSSKKPGVLSWLICRQERWLVENALVNICVSDGIERSINERYHTRGRSMAILNGVSHRFFEDQAGESEKTRTERKTVLYVGTFTPWDGASDIVRLADNFPNVDFWMIGEGDLKKEIMSKAPSNVFFYGKVEYSKLPGIYKQADAGIVLYEFERHKNVKVSSIKTLEYIASALPVFTTNIPGQEFIGAEKVGYLVAEHEDLNNAFSHFIQNLSVYKENYADRRSEFKKRFGWQKTAKATIDAINTSG